MTWTKRVLIGCTAMALLAGCGGASHSRSAAPTTESTAARTTTTKAPKRRIIHTAAHHQKHVAATTTTTVAPTTTTSPTTAPPAQHLPPLNVVDLPAPTAYTCAAGLYFLAPGNQASGECLPYSYLVGGTAADPSKDTACPAGSSMTMGPVMCTTGSGIVAPVLPGPDTCSDPGGPCPSAKLPLPSSAQVLDWSSIEFPTGTCESGYYSGDSNGIATCVPYGYLLGGTSSDPNHNTTCPDGSALRIMKLTGTLCTQEATPYDIVAPV